MRAAIWRHLQAWMLGLAFCCSVVSVAHAANPPQDVNGVQVLEAFDKQQSQKVDSAAAIGDKKKRLIMFLLGIPLLVLLLTTGAVGIAMGVFGKPLFLVHMILAGLTMTLAIVHVIVGLVWFYPF
ncbi:MAG: hypothetical protein KGL63_03885 [Betaproteobacteria bacterium]|nr:hypothetical protein [Betaproteobacteria bacterium]